MNHHLNKIFHFPLPLPRSVYIKHRLHSKYALTILEKNPIKIYESSHGKNSHSCSGVFQWNVRINSGKHRLSTINKNFHSPHCPGLLVPDPFPCVDTHVNDQAFNHISKLIMLQQSEGKKQSPFDSSVRCFAWPLKYLHDRDTGAGRAITWQKPLKQKINIIWVTSVPLLFFNSRS